MPPLFLTRAGIGSETQEQINYYCTIGAASPLQPAAELNSDVRQADYLPTGITALSELPVYRDIHGTMKATILNLVPNLSESAAHGYAHTAVGNLLLVMRASALILPQVARTMRKEEGQGWRNRQAGQPCHLNQEQAQVLANMMEQQGISADDLDDVLQLSQQNDTTIMFAKMEQGAQGAPGKLIGALGLIAVAAAIAPGIGMGASYYAGLAGMEEAIPYIVQATGMAGHESALNMSTQVSGWFGILMAQANSHLATCILPAVSASVLAMAGHRRANGENQVSQAR